MNRRNFLQRLGIGAAALAVAPSVLINDIEEVSRVESIDVETLSLWQQSLKEMEERISKQIDHFLLFGEPCNAFKGTL